MLELLSNGLVLAGMALLLGALVPVRQLMRHLPSGHVRRRWYLMAVLIGAFVAGYLGYLAIFWGTHANGLSLIVPGVFFLGAGFVWLTATLSLQTAVDIRRVVLLERESLTDALIGIYNRRYLDRRLEEECARARRYGLPLFVLLLDIDHFKRVNDTYGHQAGDQVLIYLGKLLLNGVRESDIVTRYGGEEILILAPNTSASAAVTLAERLRLHVETHALMLSSESGQRKEVRVTVSIGVAGLSEGTTDCQQLIEKADHALYRAKREGRNRVVAYGADEGGSARPGSESPVRTQAPANDRES